MKLSMTLIAAMVVTTCGACAKGRPQPAKPPQPGAEIKVPPPPTGTLSPAEQKLDAALLELAREKGDIKEPALASWGAKHQLPTEKGLVGVDITCRTAAEADRVEVSVKQAGGEITAKFENTVYARIKPGTVLALANMSEVWTIATSRKVIGRD